MLPTTAPALTVMEGLLSWQQQTHTAQHAPPSMHRGCPHKDWQHGRACTPGQGGAAANWLPPFLAISTLRTFISAKSHLSINKVEAVCWHLTVKRSRHWIIIQRKKQRQQVKEITKSQGIVQSHQALEKLLGWLVNHLIKKNHTSRTNSRNSKSKETPSPPIAVNKYEYQRAVRHFPLSFH